MGISETFRDWILSPVMAKLTNIQEALNKMAITQAQFDALLTQLGTVVTGEDSALATALTAISAAITKLQAAVAGNVDLTTEATAAQSMITDIQTQTANLAAAVTSLQNAVTPPPAS